ncbi:ferrochelatase [Ferviditalea candida]|uniref:Coproporphyrin III ferrochelatase n=1 Tax=Ferviditalea candida TaxID=3108399 RepID=A0ABU5ZD13_9BACL|nr:ferrochelatase [Paenibacillaceae bacterium T2]
MNNRAGVLVMSYGTPESMDRIEAYYTHIRRGHPPSPEQLENLKKRYEAIVGGFFPLRENTDRQVAALEQTLNRMYPDTVWTCYQGLKHARPFIEDGVQQMIEDGIVEAAGLVLAPHYSAMSVGGYIKRAQEKAEQGGLRMHFAKNYHLHPDLIDALSERVSEALDKFSRTDRDSVKVLFTAHSLPEKILEMRDPYPAQLTETAEAVSKQTGLSNWQFAWQSAGQTDAKWLGPDVLEVLRTLHGDGVRNVLICPVGFVSDHLEILYDIDIECRALANELGIQLERTESLNTDPRFMKALAETVASLLQ